MSVHVSEMGLIKYKSSTQAVLKRPMEKCNVP